MTNKHITTARIKGAGQRDLETGIYSATKHERSDGHESTAVSGRVSNKNRHACAYFVSVGKEAFSGSNLRASLGLIVSQAYNECHIISTGTLQRWNMQSEHEMSEQRAYRLALVQERIWIKECIEIISSVGTTLREHMSVSNKQMGFSENGDYTDGEIIADAEKINLKRDGVSSEEIVEFSKKNIVRVEIAQQLSPKKVVTFIIHSWDSVRTDEQFLAYDQQYRKAISNQSDWSARFSQSREITTKNFIRRRKKELQKSQHEPGKISSILQQYKNNGPKFLDEETPIVPYLSNTLQCSHIYYPGSCTAQFQIAYEFYTLGKPNASWLAIHFKNVIYDPDSDVQKVAKLLTTENAQEVSQHADLFRRHLDTIIFSEEFHRLSQKASLPCIRDNIASDERKVALMTLCGIGSDVNFETARHLFAQLHYVLSNLSLTHKQRMELTCNGAQLIEHIQHAKTPRDDRCVSSLFPSQDPQLLATSTMGSTVNDPRP